MRSRILIVLLITSCGFFANCGNDDDTTTAIVTKEKDPLAGIWNLTNVHGGLQGINIDYTVGQVKWNFNFETNMLIVENTINTTGPEDIHAGLDSGTYKFEIKLKEEIQTLYIDDVVRGGVTIEDTILKIDDGLASDGFISEFKR